ncbi:MAG: alpha/beta hydrolase [Chloroflexota bacterium]|nr:alpha/beta hydrolase [Chloroflexota bacterium]
MNLTIQQSGSKANPAIVFLHGVGVSSWMWEEQIASLKENYHCIAIDLPGNGESAHVEWKSFEDTAAQIAQVIQTLTTEGKAHVVGLSLGGYSAIFLLQLHPDVVKSLIVSGVTTKPFTRQWLWSGVMNVIPILMKIDPFIELNIKMMQLPPDAVPLYKRDAKRVTGLTFKRIYGALFNFALPIELAQRPHRLLAVAGDAEAAMVKGGLADFPALMPNATACVIPNAHHGWNGEHPKLFTDMIRAWVEGRALPDALKAISLQPAAVL